MGINSGFKGLIGGWMDYRDELDVSEKRNKAA